MMWTENKGKLLWVCLNPHQPQPPRSSPPLPSSPPPPPRAGVVMLDETKKDQRVHVSFPGRRENTC